MVNLFFLSKFNFQTEGDEDIFQPELMPSYAKSYILPRRMSRVSIAGEEIAEAKQGIRRKSFARRESMVTPEFQISMLKASLEEKQILCPTFEESDEEGEESGRTSSLLFDNLEVKKFVNIRVLLSLT